MFIIKFSLFFAFVIISPTTEAQIYKLLNLTEQQVRKRLSDKYPLIDR